MLSKQNRFNLIANNWLFVLTLIRVQMLLAVVTNSIFILLERNYCNGYFFVTGT